MILQVDVSALSSVYCFHIVGWATGMAGIQHVKTCSDYSQRFSFRVSAHPGLQCFDADGGRKGIRPIKTEW